MMNVQVRQEANSIEAKQYNVRDMRVLTAFHLGWLYSVVALVVSNSGVMDLHVASTIAII